MRLMAWFLGDAGFDVRKTTSAKESLRQQCAPEPDVVIFNTHLPEAEKAECIGALRQHAPEAVVVDIAGRGAAPAGAMAAAGERDPRAVVADSYLEIPFSGETLVDTVRALV